MSVSQVRREATLEILRDNRLEPETKKNYKSAMRQLSLWLLATGRGAIVADDGSIDLHQFQYDDFAEFIASKYKTSNCKPSTLASYRSAMKDYYQRNNIVIPEEFNNDIKSIFQGELPMYEVLISALGIRRMHAAELQTGGLKDSG
ncbi:hypothetical protein LEN26_001540 [Aphanomyces euteiches]|nr:hypothetical protein AeMF1_017170 [Aphanomyces euteiches]KAH9111843.1 hypothetical protein LEN26_013379 [Aphanomyces euteiches]KAH9161187.1 hypothetical protein LEN26_001540 [Aphanomyces euteiches]KAH9184588.1 hypothetical protein AeNC1_013436 [Aphanomyces euteiches]